MRPPLKKQTGFVCNPRVLKSPSCPLFTSVVVFGLSTDAAEDQCRHFENIHPLQTAPSSFVIFLHCIFGNADANVFLLFTEMFRNMQLCAFVSEKTPRRIKASGKYPIPTESPKGANNCDMS
ncbi:hypothetical protein CDAR_277701 [Caerostris darwini]|uniref:Uncharacterized protein n=1 Tax=Caerostris darwini TaxID=1538125 RepID=A0AAV4RPR8_9ARAC|nr:hypothetical protein CDAR_277701 [Caerostris darwini]